MKRKLHFKNILALLLLLVYSPSEAKRITQWQAQQQAYSFWGKQMPQKARAKSRTANTASRSDAYYVFNNDAGGFVIIAGDDAVAPVLGYTSTGTFDAGNLPDGLKDLLKSYERQIAALANSNQATRLPQEPVSAAKSCSIPRNGTRWLHSTSTRQTNIRLAVRLRLVPS